MFTFSVSCPVPMFTYHLICQDSLFLVELCTEHSPGVQEGMQAVILQEWEGGSCPGAGGKDNSLREIGILAFRCGLGKPYCFLFFSIYDIF